MTETRDRAGAAPDFDAPTPGWRLVGLCLLALSAGVTVWLLWQLAVWVLR